MSEFINPATERLQKVIPLVMRPEWDLMLVYLSELRAGLHSRLEDCPVDSLKAIQGELRIINHLLTLRETISKLIKK